MTNVPIAAGEFYRDGDDTLNPNDGDRSGDIIDVAAYGTDYILFRAGSYFSQGVQHELKFRLHGASLWGTGFPEANRMTPIGWVLGYCCDVAQPQTNPQHLIFIEPMTFVPTTTLGEVVTSEFTVTDFGRSIKMVAVAISGTVNVLATATVPPNYLNYSYEFGVYTPTTTNITWSGTVLLNADRTVPLSRTLTILPGTRVRVSNIDRTPGGVDSQKTELIINGSLLADGTAASPINFEPWTPTTTEDWVGIFFSSTSTGGTLDNCRISRAEYGIESFKPLTITNTTIEDCFFAGMAARGGNSLVQGCTIRRPGQLGVFAMVGNLTLRNTTIDDAVTTGCYVDVGAGLTARNSQFINSDTGLFVNGMAPVSIDSTCSFNSNGIGINCYGTNNSTSIARSTVLSNTVDGIMCASESRPPIQNCQILSNYVGLYCIGTNTGPSVSNSTFNNNTGAVNVDVGANPDLGNGGSFGNNTFLTSTGYHVANANAWNVMAEINYWNSSTPPCFPKASKIIGPVDFNPSICSNPNPSSPAPEVLPKPADEVVIGILATTPNPFNPSVTIAYGVPRNDALVTIGVFDVQGRVVRELVNGHIPAGRNEVVWDGTDSRGQPVASSVYFVRMYSGSIVDTKKIVLLK